MEFDVTDVLTKSPMLLTFLVIGFGYLLGNIRTGLIDVDATAGVLVTGLLLGHLDLPRSSAASAFEFAVLIVSVR